MAIYTDYLVSRALTTHFKLGTLISPLSSPPLPSPQLLIKMYGDYIVEPESGYDFSLQFEYENLPENKGR